MCFLSIPIRGDAIKVTKAAYVDPIPDERRRRVNGLANVATSDGLEFGGRSKNVHVPGKINDVDTMSQP